MKELLKNLQWFVGTHQITNEYGMKLTADGVFTEGESDFIKNNVGSDFKYYVSAGVMEDTVKALLGTGKFEVVTVPDTQVDGDNNHYCEELRILLITSPHCTVIIIPSNLEVA